MDADEFRRAGHALIDWIAEYRETLEARPVMSAARPGEIRARLPRQPPERGGGAGELPALLERDVLPGITHWNHPAFFAYFPANTSYASILGDLAGAGLGVQGMSWQTSPAATEIEEVDGLAAPDGGPQRGAGPASSRTPRAPPRWAR